VLGAKENGFLARTKERQRSVQKDIMLCRIFAEDRLGANIIPNEGTAAKPITSHANSEN